jgi:hypothetical protein
MTPMNFFALLAISGFALSALCAWIFRQAAAKSKADAIFQTRLAEVAKTRVSHMQNLNKDLEQLQQKQRAETIDETTPQHLALRADFDNDWSNGLSGSAASASHSGRTDTSGASDSPGD